MIRSTRKVAVLVMAVAAFAMAGCASHGAKTGAETQPVAQDSGINTNANAGQSGVDANALQQAAEQSHSIYFALDSSDIDAQYQAVVSNWAKYLLAVPGAQVQVQGNTDERGTRAYNQALGERRATAVQAALEAQGVPAAQVSTTSFGKERPVCAQHAESCWSQNRRADLIRQ
ncbi:MAG: peptidoglycan-associated lipoprotein Pal [Nevskiaceae bacterium]|nr:MAG: peptidoglycan-associated lipoprotein Pal [Nevskiaceae bacterium]TBR74075.1 MAG: peptidoglycan-associated lipoprotein Pal [Nevskiaceae bacterium]